jgi:hypothetical protein
MDNFRGHMATLLFPETYGNASLAIGHFWEKRLAGAALYLLMRGKQAKSIITVYETGSGCEIKG